MNISKKNYRSNTMAKFNYLSTLFNQTLKKRPKVAFITGLAIVLSIISLVPIFSGVPVAAASTGMNPINLVFYGTHDSAIDRQIVAAKPIFLIDNTPAGPWGGEL